MTYRYTLSMVVKPIIRTALATILCLIHGNSMDLDNSAVIQTSTTKKEEAADILQENIDFHMSLKNRISEMKSFAQRIKHTLATSQSNAFKKQYKGFLNDIDYLTYIPWHKSNELTQLYHEGLVDPAALPLLNILGTVSEEPEPTTTQKLNIAHTHLSEPGTEPGNNEFIVTQLSLALTLINTSVAALNHYTKIIDNKKT